jgi:ATP-dependent protease ClpP protease subunit
MKPEVLIYGNINEYSAAEFIREINAANSEDLTIRVNTNGGEVRYGWGMVTKIAELTGRKLLKNDGDASSMGAYAFCYADDSEAIDVATFTFHRAGYAAWIESNPDYFTDADKVDLARMNKSLRAAFEAKVDVDKFAEITKVTVDQLFSMDGRIDVTITAKDAKKIGLINRIVTITPQKKAEIEAKTIEITALRNGFKIAAQTEDKTINKKTMTKEQLKNEHSAVYAEIVNEAKAEAIKAERDRVGAAMVFVDIDPTAVKEVIKSGEALSQTMMAELSLKKLSALAEKKVETETETEVKTETPETEQKKSEAVKTEDQKAMAEVIKLTMEKIAE